MTHPAIRRLWSWVRLSRPHFLIGGGLMFGLGAATARPIDAFGYFVGQLMVTASQLTAHYVNEYADREADRGVTHRTLFSGGSGVLVEEHLPPAAARRAAMATSLVSLTAAVILIGTAPVAALTGAVTLVVSWGYSIPPLRLLSTGFGEVAATGVVVAAVPLIGALTQHGDLSVSLAWMIAMLAPVHLAMMLAFELPDLESDAAAGKRVLAVRTGRSATIVAIAVLLVLAGTLMFASVVADGLPGASGLAGVAVLPGVAMVVAAKRDRHHALTFAAVATFVLTGAPLLAGQILTHS